MAGGAPARARGGRLDVMDNCLTHALDQLTARGGYLAARSSAHWPVLHVLHVAADGQITHLVPPAPLRRPVQALAGFAGVVRRADDAALARPLPVGALVISAWLFALGATAWGLRRALRRLLRR